MFLICPASFDLEEAQWFLDLDNAKDDALDWSVELNGERVIVYEAIEEKEPNQVYGAYKFNKILAITA
jgi:hypothetical protein